ncbi:oxygenase MpaB family protein [Parendozoicomonas haliclonae]|uniref:ER-bound oxygenase mpaB/mpaB'/Rubber oxygenase catalytic domain-containing protein n=1 Tax=Parendozoicomonas haliclonae TaxID=1960125 RepID=A0A1X7ADT5_9GAMM|nr:oxygenase MpaB family protein [Parendozoicomonas haliclonae]SMA32729.1 hypothetical protein EHSB41UT_00185 [Parendozoicomonas haliclonae]
MLVPRNNKKLKSLQSNPSDYHNLVRYLANHDMPLDFLIAGELAQIQTFGIPSISKILRRTRQYQDHGTKRLDDTKAILVEIMTDSVHSPRGQHMVKHLNWIHSHYPISNEDYLYTLALFILEPDRWARQFSYRSLTDAERDALYQEFRDLGEAMNIKDIPDSFQAFQHWHSTYKARHLTYHPDNHVVAQGLIDGMKPMVPSYLRPFIQSLILVLLNDGDLVTAIGMKKPSAPMRLMVHSVMGIRRLWLKFFNPWQNTPFNEGQIATNYPSYPGGYQASCLGPEKLIRNVNQRNGCPYQ